MTVSDDNYKVRHDRRKNQNNSYNLLDSELTVMKSEKTCRPCYKLLFKDPCYRLNNAQRRANKILGYLKDRTENTVFSHIEHTVEYNTHLVFERLNKMKKWSVLGVNNNGLAAARLIVLIPLDCCRYYFWFHLANSRTCSYLISQI